MKKIRRVTKETHIEIKFDTEGKSDISVNTGLKFFDHMLSAFACHGRFGLSIKAKGDVDVDPHHLIEDVGIVLGKAIKDSFNERIPVSRAGYFSFPMDMSLANVALDLCGRPNLVWNVPLKLRKINEFDLSLIRDFFKALSDSMRSTIHINVPYSDNDHHALEAVFKAFGRSLKYACEPIVKGKLLSTKGKIDD